MKQKKFKGLSALCVLVLTIAITLSACGSSAGNSGDTQSAPSDSTSSNAQTDPDVKTEGGSLVYGMTQDLVSLDPHISTDAGTRSVVFNIYEGLVKPTSAGDLEGAVAESYTISEDAKTYTFTLRDGVIFHDGSPVTAEDVKYSIERYAEVQGDTSAFSSEFDTVEIKDDKTICVTLKEPNSEFISQFTLAVIPKSNPDPAKDPIGCGPYKVESYEPGRQLKLTKFEDYRQEAQPYLDTVTFKFISDVNTAMTELKAGSIDVLNYLTAAQVKELEGTKPGAFSIVQGNMNLVHAMFLNNSYGPLKDLNVRKAICAAVDKDAINNFLFDGKSTIIGSHMIPALKTWYEPQAETINPYDVEKAKQYLQESEYPNGFDLEITVPSSYSQHIDTAQIISDQLSQIGINCTIRTIEWSSWLEEVYHERQYQATVIGFDGKLNPSDWLAKYGTDASNNIANYSNDQYDEILAKAEETTDMSEKQTLYKELQMNLAENAASVYIEDPADFVALNSKFGGYEFYPTAAWDVSKIYVKGN